MCYLSETQLYGYNIHTKSKFYPFKSTYLESNTFKT